jgi:DHA1 family bicyclomycin/chloramphenicol resistance-like MFS transporter
MRAAGDLRQRAAIIGALGLVSERLATTVFLPAMPFLADAFHIPHDMAQHSVPAFLIGVAVSQLIWGYVSDLWGRRRVLLILVPCYVAVAGMTATATSFSVVLLGLFLQGSTIGAVFTVTQAVVGEVFGKDGSARALAGITTFLAWSTAVGTIIGGFVAHHFDWRAVFVLLAILVAVTWPAYIVVPASASRSRNSAPPSGMLRNYRNILSEPDFRRYLPVVVLVNLGFFAFLTASPFLVIKAYGVSAHHFGLLMLIPTAGLALGRLVCATLGQHVERDRMIHLGGLVVIAGGIAMVGAQVTGIQNSWTLMVTMAVYLVGAGISLPVARATAMHAAPGFVGSAASLISVTVNAAGSVASAIAAHLPDTFLCWLILAAGVCNLVGFYWSRPTARAG